MILNILNLGIKKYKINRQKNKIKFQINTREKIKYMIDK